MTFGWLRPQIFLPADALEWDEERRRLVILHEVAHVRRLDCAAHVVARVALCVYWWNPLAWIAWRDRYPWRTVILTSVVTPYAFSTCTARVCLPRGAHAHTRS